MIAEAQKINKKFLSYQNPRLGFRLLYPSDWQVLEENPGRVIFISPEQNATLRIIVENASKDFDVNRLTTTANDSSTAHTYAMNEIKAIQGVASHIHNNEVAIGTRNISGWRVDYMLSSHYVMDTILVTEGNRFILRYVDLALKVPHTLSTIQAMLDSFQVIKMT
jgi:hypothetical protein